MGRFAFCVFFGHVCAVIPADSSSLYVTWFWTLYINVFVSFINLGESRFWGVPRGSNNPCCGLLSRHTRPYTHPIPTSFPPLSSYSIPTFSFPIESMARIHASAWYVQNVSTFPNTFAIVSSLICIFWIQLTWTNVVFSRIALVSCFCAEIQLSGKIPENTTNFLFY
jgi:hypothetical protein